MQCVRLYICWWYSVCVVMPVVTHQAVKGSAVCRPDSPAASHPQCSPVHFSPGSRTQPLLHQRPLAAAPERSHSQKFKGEKMANTSVEHPLSTFPFDTLPLWPLAAVTSIFILYFLFTFSRWLFFVYVKPHKTFLLAWLLCFEVSCCTFFHPVWATIKFLHLNILSDLCVGEVRWKSKGRPTKCLRQWKKSILKKIWVPSLTFYSFLEAAKIEDNNYRRRVTFEHNIPEYIQILPRFVLLFV